MYSSSIEPQSGFHRTFSTSITLRDHLDCTVHLYYQFPVLVFVDPYELANHEHLFTFAHYGNADLELPVGAMDGENGTSLLLTLSRLKDEPQVIQVELPLHLRYGDISHTPRQTHRSAEIPWPELYLACPESADTGVVAPAEFASVFQAGASLYVPVPDAAAARFEVVSVPVGQDDEAAQVQLGTVCTILAMFFYMVYTVYGTAKRLEKKAKKD